ncbi:very short patch repair endonuclease [Streptomyces sp. NPDC001985]|uniref:very short patch repair endonuclease n=1 Tax=Streptomyces sp. NPDC001985 TaxID=3154406 RepID=UPI0033264805
MSSAIPPMIPSSPGVSERMRRQSSRDTKCEIEVRKLLHANGLRYRVHVPVPGIPRRNIDVAFRPVKVAVFLDGCFWHGCPQHATRPAANASSWSRKLDGNMARDRATTAHLEAQGWTVLRFWEHEAPEEVAARVARTVRRLRAAL